MEVSSNSGLLDALPPRLEDAGLEDSALPAHSIQEAFKRAGEAMQTAQRQVQSTATGIFGSIGGRGEEVASRPFASNGFGEESCVDPKGPAVLGGGKSCTGNKGGLIEEGHDVVIGSKNGHTEGDKVVFGVEGGPKLGDAGCVEGLAGDKGEEKKKPEEKEDGPILVLA